MEVGNGHLRSIWNDVWLGDSPLVDHALVAVRYSRGHPGVGI